MMTNSPYKKEKISKPWKKLNKTQKKTRLLVYSVIGLFYGLGIMSFILKQIAVGIICVLLASAFIYVIYNLPYWYMSRFYKKADEEFREHKNDEDKNKIYLTGNQMRQLFSDGVLDLGTSLPPILLEEVFNKDGGSNEQ